MRPKVNEIGAKSPRPVDWAHVAMGDTVEITVNQMITASLWRLNAANYYDMVLQLQEIVREAEEKLRHCLDAERERIKAAAFDLCARIKVGRPEKIVSFFGNLASYCCQRRREILH